MQRNERGVLLSASDLMRFAGCAHATTLDLAWMMGRGAAPGEDSEDAQLLQRHGDAHEARHLARLKRRGPGRRRDRPGGRVAGAGRRRRPARRWSAVPSVVFQGALAGGAWGGWSDFLERVERPSALGRLVLRGRRHQAEAQAAPEARPAARALLRPARRACRGWRPSTPMSSSATGRGRRSALADVSAYARRVRSRLEAFVAAPAPTRPVPCADCPLCRWREQCAARLAERGQPVPGGERHPRAGGEAGGRRRRRRWRRSPHAASRCAAWRPRRWRGW